MLAQNNNLPIHEEKSRGIYVKGLREIYVSSLAEIYQIIKKGNQVRAAAATSRLNQFVWVLFDSFRC